MADEQSGPEEIAEAGAETGLTPGGELPASLAEQLQAAWSKRQPKWYERLAPAQKHWVDKLVALRLAEFQDHLAALDREDSQLAHQVAEMTTQIAHLNRRLAALEARLEQSEPSQQDQPE
jgi:septal ring factor EnvC (AmiA/AmiB activator)